jgi:hypothetical protein
MTGKKNTSIEMPVHEITGPNIGGCYFMYFYSCPIFFVCPVVRVPQFLLFYSHRNRIQAISTIGGARYCVFTNKKHALNT